MSKTPTLLPCPFCGGTARLVRDPKVNYAECKTQGCRAEGPWQETEARAIAAWNERASPPSPSPADDGVRALEKARDYILSQAEARNYDPPVPNDLVAEIDAALSAIPSPPAGEGWRPIETAPKDGTDVLLYAPAGMWDGKPTEARVTVGHWTTDEECRSQVGDCGGECRCPEYHYEDPYWLSWDGGFLKELPPTHWMPLPPAPATGEGA